MLNISGKYEVDRERSESLYPHMVRARAPPAGTSARTSTHGAPQRALGCDEIAALASEKLVVTLDIFQTPASITIHQTSQLGETTRVLRLDGETLEHDGRRATVTLSASSIHVDTRFAKGRLSDTRVLDDEGMAQVLELTVKGLPNAITTKRYMKRVGPSEHVM
jgi:hypothetical protein